MGKNPSALLLIFCSTFLITALASYAETHFPNADDSGRPNLCLGKEKVTKLRFYLQDVLGGNNRTAWDVAKSNLTDILPSRFGLVKVLDDLLTSEPDIRSKEVGRMQGFIGFTDLREEALTSLVNVVFTEGEYKGSTLAILGRNPVGDKTREMPVVGGSGAFRMARGYAITRTSYLNEDRSYGVFQYDVVVYHYNMNDITSF